MTTLYVVGNGFDRHHGMATSYVDFGKFLSRHHQVIRDLLDRYFSTDEESFWHHFEEELASFDADGLIDDNSCFLSSYADENWSDSGHHDYEYELTRAVEGLSTGLLGAFTEWVQRICIPSRRDLGRAVLNRIDPTALFLNFNYTRTLQELYDVPDQRVWHIHGIVGQAEPLVLGHGWLPKADQTFSARLDPERDDVRVVDGARVVDDYFKRTFKPTDKIIAANLNAFTRLGDVDDIRVLGHSLADVDLPYLQRIASSVRTGTQWRIGYHRDQSDMRKQFPKIASAGRATYLPLQEV